MGKGRRIKGVLPKSKQGTKSKSTKKQGNSGPIGMAALENIPSTPGTGAAPSGSSQQGDILDKIKSESEKALLEEAVAKESFLRKFLQKLGTVLKGLLLFFFKRDFPIAHYVALILVIIFLIVGFSFLVIRSTKKRKDKKNA